MVINLRSFNRNKLSASQKEFLLKASPWAYDISDMVISHSEVLRNRVKYTIHPTLVLADIIIESQWGEHPLSQLQYEKKYANNLSLLKLDPLWDGRSHEYQGTKYKAFRDWLHFSTSYSDWLIYSKSKVLEVSTLEGQIKELAKTKEIPSLFSAKAETLIEFYELTSLHS